MERGLDLSRQGLTQLAQIPQDIVRNAERDGEPYALSLAQNRLTQLSDLHIFQSVIQLDLSANQIQSLDGIQALRQLESLNIARNSLASIDPLALLSNLRILNVAENNLVHLDATRHLTKISAIDASSNNISKWPQFSHINTLESVDLSGNTLDAFPVGAAGRIFPVSLRRLSLAKNHIQELCGIAALGMFLPNIQILKIDANPSTQRIQRDVGSLDFMWVNLFANISFVHSRGGGGPRRDDFVVDSDVVQVIEDAVQRGKEDVLIEFLLSGTAPPMYAAAPHAFAKQQPLPGANTARWGDVDAYHHVHGTRKSDAFKVDELSHGSRLPKQDTYSFDAPPSAPLLPPAQVTQPPTNEGLSKESKMDLWKRMMAQRKEGVQQDRAVPSQQQQQDVVRAGPAVVNVIPPLPSPPPAARGVASAVAIPHQQKVQMRSLAPAPSPSSSSPPAVSIPSPMAPPSMDALASQVKTLQDHVSGMRKYVKVWVKREQFTREAAAKSIQRFMRRRQERKHLHLAIQRSRDRRLKEYAVEHCFLRATTFPPLPANRLDQSATVIQRHLRGWISRYRVSRWMYYTQAAELIQRAWRHHSHENHRVKRELGLTRPRRRHGERPREERRDTELLASAVATLTMDVKQLQRVFVLQEQMLARQWQELANYKEFVVMATYTPVVKVQCLWRGYVERRKLGRSKQLRPQPQNINHSKRGDELDELKRELQALKAVVQQLVDKNE